LKSAALIKRFGPKTVLRGLNFQVEQGEFVALLGPNGAGKSTFLRILASLSRASLGTVKIAGYSLPDHAAEVRHRLGVVTHQPLVYGELSAEENLRFYGRMYAVDQFGRPDYRDLEPGGTDRTAQRPGAHVLARHAAAPGDWKSGSA
jgi:heme exporter protein A